MKQEVPEPVNENSPRFTMVFDRESYEPKWFIELWKNHRVAIITYRKNVKEKWDTSQFNNTETQLLNSTLRSQFISSSALFSIV